MTTSNPTSNPTSAHRPNAPTAYSAEGMQPARVAPRRGGETKAAFKTTEFIACRGGHRRAARVLPRRYH